MIWCFLKINFLISHNVEWMTKKSLVNYKMEKKEKVWIPLEGNPRIFTEYAERLGYPTIMFKFHDVFSLDKDVW